MERSVRQFVLLVVLVAVFTLVGYGASVYGPKIPRLGNTETITDSQTVKTVSYQGEDSKTVLELLQRDHKVEVQDSSFGAFVSSIDGTAANENSIWLYYIDGEQGVTDAKETVTKTGQTIEWRYETF